MLMYVYLSHYDTPFCFLQTQDKICKSKEKICTCQKYAVSLHSKHKNQQISYIQTMEKKLTKSTNKMVAGVCSGIAEYFGWDATLTRIAYVALTLFTACFPGVLLYIIMCIIMPQKEV